MSPEQLIAKALEQREAWVDLEPGRRVRVRRPAEADFFRFSGSRATSEDFLRCVVGWDGFDEACILPPGVGGDAVVPFHVDLWITLAQDNLVWCGKVAEQVVDAIKKHLDRQDATAKN